MKIKRIPLKLIGFVFFVIVVISVVFTAITSSTVGKYSEDKKDLTIVTSFYPLYFFTSSIVGDNASVTNITPPGFEPHDYELTPRDVSLIESSDLVVLNGGNLELWAENITNNLLDKQVIVIYTATDLMTRSVEEDGLNQADPHVWLDPVLAQKQVDRILQEVISLDPVNSQEYQMNAQQLTQKLTELDAEFKQALGSCEKKQIVTTHAAFGYLTDRYGLEQVSLSGLSPEYEPSPKEFAEIAEFARKNNIKYIFFESLVSPRMAETIAKEIGADTLVFNPLEGLTEEEQNMGMDYFSVQRENIRNISQALECN